MAPSLRDLDVLVLDCQATGASPRHGDLLEVGWTLHRATRPEPSYAAIESRLVALPEGGTIPPAITRITGLRDTDLRGASTPAKVWAALRAAARPGIPTVIHFARFELPFLHGLHARFGGPEPFPFDVVCTHSIARRLFADLPRRGLRALAGYLGHSLPELKRAAGHVAATAFVWTQLVDHLAAHEDVHDLPGLRELLAREPDAKPDRRVYPMPRERRLALPDGPGVYRFLNGAGTVVYVGKATSLRRRVNSYFRRQHGVPERALEMLTQARDVDVTPVDSALEAALLEADEIKRLAPPYNKALRDLGRELWFCSADFGSTSVRADRVHRIGAFHDERLPRSLGALARVLAARSAPSDEAIHAVLTRGPTPRPDPRCFAGGLALLRAELRGVDVAALVRLGHRRWAERLATASADEDPDVAEEPTDDGEAEGWDPERVHDALGELLLRTAHAVRRTRWLCRLTESTVVFREPNADDARVLHVAGGAIAERSGFDHRRTAPVPGRWRRSEPSRRRGLDVATYDRLRVLATELRRIVAGGGSVQVRLGPRRWLENKAVHATLRWV